MSGFQPFIRRFEDTVFEPLSLTLTHSCGLPLRLEGMSRLDLLLLPLGFLLLSLGFFEGPTFIQAACSAPFGFLEPGPLASTTPMSWSLKRVKVCIL